MNGIKLPWNKGCCGQAAGQSTNPNRSLRAILEIEIAPYALNECSYLRELGLLTGKLIGRIHQSGIQSGLKAMRVLGLFRIGCRQEVTSWVTFPL